MKTNAEAMARVRMMGPSIFSFLVSTKKQRMAQRVMMKPIWILESGFLMLKVGVGEWMLGFVKIDALKAS